MTTDTTPAENVIELKAINQIHLLHFKEYYKREFLKEKYSHNGLLSFIAFHVFSEWIQLKCRLKYL